MRIGVLSGVAGAMAIAMQLGMAQAQTVLQTAPSLKPTIDNADDIAAEDQNLPPPVIMQTPAEPETLPPRKRKIIANPFGPQPIPVGSFDLYPQLEIGAQVESDANSAKKGRQADGALRIKPSLRFASDWSRHSWTGSANASWLRYAKNDDLSSLTGSAETTFRLDIRHTTFAEFSAHYDVTQTQAGQSEVPSTAIGERRNHDLGLSTSLNHDFGGLEGSAKFSLDRKIFEDVALSGGGTENNADRNFVEPQLRLRGTLGQFNQPLRPFAELRYAPRFHDQTKDRNGQKRNSQGAGGSFGLSFNDSPYWSGELAAGYDYRRYADPALSAASVLGLNGTLIWQPTDLTTIVANSSFSLDESSQSGVSANPTWAAGVDITHAIRDNVSLIAGLSGSLTKTSADLEKSATAKAGIEWLANPNLAANLIFENTWTGASASTEASTDQKLIASIILRP